MPAIVTALPGALRERTDPHAGRLRRLVRHGLPRFLLVGFAGLACDATLFWTLAAAGAPEAAARLASLAAATLLTWLLNRRLTFAASGRTPPREAVRYGLVALGAQGLNLGLFLGLRSALPEVRPLVALVACAAVATLFSFTGHSLLTFGTPDRIAGVAGLGDAP